MDGLCFELISKARKPLDDYALANMLIGTDGVVVEIVSGGIRLSPKDPFPALYLSQELAIKNWGRAVNLFVGTLSQTSSKVRVVRPPDLVKYQMTETDMRQQQRVVATRWAVTAMVAAEGYNYVDD